MATSATFTYAYAVTGTGPSYTIGAEAGGGGYDLNDNDPASPNDVNATVNSTLDNGLINVADYTTPSPAGMSGGSIVAYQSTTNEVIVSDGTNSYLLTNTPYGSGSTFTPNTTSGVYTYCFLTGTQISTPNGCVAVETLAIGDEVLTVDGKIATVRFNFHQVKAGHIFAGKKHYPVKISAGALAENVPSRDLYVTPDHAIYLPEWNIFAEASTLINGTSIYQVQEMPENFTYYHILCDNQEIILAENTPTETFIDNATMEEFDNYADYVAMYPNEHDMMELDIPRAKASRQLPRALKQQLADRAAVLFPTQLAA